MDVKQLDILFHEYGYEAKELNTSYRVYVLNQGMHPGTGNFTCRKAHIMEQN